MMSGETEVRETIDPGRTSTLVLKPLPDPQAFYRQKTEWVTESIDALGAAGLYEVALGKEPEAFKTIIDYDLSLLPPLLPTDRSYNYRQSEIAKANRENQRNAILRRTKLLRMRTQVYIAVRECCKKHNILLAEEIQENCDLTGRQDELGFNADGMGDGPVCRTV